MNITNTSRLAKQAGAAGFLLIVMSGCATFSADGGMSPVADRVAAAIGKDVAKVGNEADAQAIQTRVSELLSSPLTDEAAAQIALLNNRGLQAQYNSLGLSEAAYITASLPPNPTLSLERISGSGILEIERRLAFDVLDLLTLPVRKKLGETQFRAAQYGAVEATFRLAAETRRAFYRAVAAKQIVAFLEEALVSAEAAADLTRSLGETGAATRLDQARAAAYYADISNQVSEARLIAASEREALTRALGLWGDDAKFDLPVRLPNLPMQLEPVGNLEADAIRQRVDLVAARHRLDATARALGLTEATRFISLLELSGISRTDRDGGSKSTSQGFEVAIQIPIFDFGSVSVRRAKEIYMQAVNELTEMAINARSEVRDAYRAYNGFHEISLRYENEILPMGTIINEETLLKYNGMLVDAFELLATARESIGMNIDAIEARRNFFIADVNFRNAMIAGEHFTGIPESGMALSTDNAGGDH